jgi:hypothetical protein
VPEEVQVFIPLAVAAYGGIRHDLSRQPHPGDQSRLRGDVTPAMGMRRAQISMRTLWRKGCRDMRWVQAVRDRDFPLARSYKAGFGTTLIVRTPRSGADAVAAMAEKKSSQFVNVT